MYGKKIGYTKDSNFTPYQWILNKAKSGSADVSVPIEFMELLYQDWNFRQSISHSKLTIAGVTLHIKERN